MTAIEKNLEIFSNLLSESVLKVSPLIGKGSVNEVFKVETASDIFIVRINNKGFFDEYEKERWATARAKEENLPVAEILKIGIVGEKAYSVQEFIAGEEGRNAAIDKNYIWKTLGSYARRIHTVSVAGFGLQYSDFITGNAQKSWLTHLEYNIESLNETDEMRKLGVLTKEISEKARNSFENLRLQNFQFGLNHGDLSLKNTIVDASGNIYLIDWGSSEAGIVPHLELIELLKMSMLENNPDETAFQAFLDGYGISHTEYQAMLPNLKSLSVLRAFDKLRWAIDWKIANLEDYIWQAKETIRRFLL